MKHLSYDAKGRLDSNAEFEEPGWVRVTLEDDGTFSSAQTYCPVTEMDIDCSKEFARSDTWMNRVVQDFCDRENAREHADRFRRMG